MQVKCGCGKLLNVPESAAGKRVKCPGCSKVFQVPAAKAPAAAPAAASADKIVIECSCGKRLAAPASAAGKRVRCPGCKNELTVPDPNAPPAPPEEEIGLEIDPSSMDQPEEEEYGITTPKCPNCNAALGPGAQFCVQCGTHMETGGQVEAANAAEAKKEGKRAMGRKVLIIVAICLGSVIVLVAVAAGVFFFWLKGAEKKQSGPKASLLEGKETEGYIRKVMASPTRVEADRQGQIATQTVKAFWATEGRWPKELDELKTAPGYELPKLADGFVYRYDLETHVVTVTGADIEPDGRPPGPEGPP